MSYVILVYSPISWNPLFLLHSNGYVNYYREVHQQEDGGEDFTQSPNEI